MLTPHLSEIQKKISVQLIRWQTLNYNSEEQILVSNFSKLLDNYEEDYNSTASICPQLVNEINTILSLNEKKIESALKPLSQLLAKFITIKCVHTGITRYEPISEENFILFLSQSIPQSSILQITLDIVGTTTHAAPYEIDEVRDKLAKTTNQLDKDIEQLKAHTITTLLDIEKKNQTTKDNLLKVLDTEKNTVNDLLEKYQNISKTALNTLSSSFRKFKRTKRMEMNGWKKAAKNFGIAALVIAFFGIIGHPAGNLLVKFDQAKSIGEFISDFFSDTLLYILIFEALIIYFFRISLNNFYAARDELLQLEIREALCLFAPTYSTFAATDDDRLNDFSKHVFSPLVSKLNPTPHPLDFLGQVSQLVNSGKKK